jgi:hypothetical protein
VNIERPFQPAPARRFPDLLHAKTYFWLIKPLALGVLVLFLLSPEASIAAPKRLVVIKVDGLPYDLLDSFVRERDPRSGKSKLPWIDHIFYQRGSRLANFYVRGTSLSAPSWSLLDTGQHLQVKGNVEFDRYTLHAYDYLNFIPFYFKSAAGARIDMPGVEVLDSLGLPLLSDVYPHEQRYIGFQLYQRGMRFNTLREALQKRYLKDPRALMSEWTMGFENRSTFFDQMERELLQKLTDPKVRYLDLYVSGFDHVAHHNRDRRSHLFEMIEMDSLIGRIWTAIEKSDMASETALVVVSDHGMNTDEQIYSQGYNLVKLLGSAAGGGHHVITKRRLLMEYAIKGMYFMVPLITTTTNESYYLKRESTSYPTALLDFDGNERASIHLRNSDLNVLHILLRQLQQNSLPAPVRNAVTASFFELLDSRRAGWQKNLSDLSEELAVLRFRVEQQRKLWEAEPKKFTREEIELGRDDQKKRVLTKLEKWVSQEKDYSEYARTLGNLLALKRENFTPAKLKVEDLIAKNAMGERNSIFQLQNYIVGIGPGGLVLRPDGALDLQKSFKRVDYFSLLHDITVRNNVQRGVSNRPVDMLATRISADLVLPKGDAQAIHPDVIWVNGGPETQALILGRTDPQGNLSFRYVPIKHLTQDSSGRITFESAPWQPGLPLRIFEDEHLAVTAEKEAWLNEWHTDVEWLKALHQTEYSNGLIGLFEEVARHTLPSLSPDEPGITDDERISRRYLKRQRELAETDLLLVANNHWNFDVRGFNPGGNHGSFFRVSTHSVFMLAGGDKSDIPQGVVVEEPYDSLSFLPTMLALTGNLRDDNNPNTSLWDKGFRRFPGRIVKDVLTQPEKPKTAVMGANVSR